MIRAEIDQTNAVPEAEIGLYHDLIASEFVLYKSDVNTSLVLRCGMARFGEFDVGHDGFYRFFPEPGSGLDDEDWIAKFVYDTLVELNAPHRAAIKEVPSE